MSRKPSSTEDDVSLFPFLSVLACIIGTLTLMIAAMALGQMDNETVVTSEQYEQVQKQLVEVRATVDKLKKKRTPGDFNRQFDLARAQTSLDTLEGKLQAVRKEAGDVNTEQPMPDVDLEALEKELAALTEQVKKLEQLVAQRNRPEEAEVVVRPGGSGLDIDPWFVECRSDSIVIYSDEEPVRISNSQLAGDQAFLDLLDKVAKNPKASVVFLIREDGIGTYAPREGSPSSTLPRTPSCPCWGKARST